MSLLMTGTSQSLAMDVSLMLCSKVYLGFRHAVVSALLHLCLAGIFANADAACVTWLTTTFWEYHCVF